MKKIDLIPWKGFPHLLSMDGDTVTVCHNEPISVGDVVYRGKGGVEKSVTDVVVADSKGAWGDIKNVKLYTLKVAHQ